MKTYLIRYCAGLLFMAIGIYEWIENKDLPETLLYISLGISFILMGFIAHYPSYGNKRLLNIFSWLFIAIAALSFLYVLTISG